VCTFSLLVPGEPQGEGKGEEVAIDVAVFSALAEHCYETLNTGTHALVEGSLVQRRWQGPGGISQSKYEVIAQVVRVIEN
jgi:single-stranded DNA-binding protein